MTYPKIVDWVDGRCELWQMWVSESEADAVAAEWMRAQRTREDTRYARAFIDEKDEGLLFTGLVVRETARAIGGRGLEKDRGVFEYRGALDDRGVQDDPGALRDVDETGHAGKKLAPRTHSSPPLPRPVSISQDDTKSASPSE